VCASEESHVLRTYPWCTAKPALAANMCPKSAVKATNEAKQRTIDDACRL